MGRFVNPDNSAFQVALNSEIYVAETLKDVRRALLDADVNYKVAKNFTDTVKEKALGQNVINHLFVF